MNKFNLTKEENPTNYTMYTGIALKLWEEVWKDKNLTDRETNVTDDKWFALDYSYDFTTGKYDDVIVEISNIPLDAFLAYRVGNQNENYYFDDDDDEEETYSDDDDFHSMCDMSEEEKKKIIGEYSLFLVTLYDYKDIITTKLIKM